MILQLPQYLSEQPPNSYKYFPDNCHTRINEKKGLIIFSTGRVALLEKNCVFRNLSDVKERFFLNCTIFAGLWVFFAGRLAFFLKKSVVSTTFHVLQK